MEFIKQKLNIIILIAITVVGGTGVVFFYTKSQSASSKSNPLSILADPLQEAVKNDVETLFQRDNTPYKDIVIKVTKNDGSIALVKITSSVREACMLATKDWSLKSPSENPSMLAIEAADIPLGYEIYSQRDVDVLHAMGVRLSDNNWKRCYFVFEYHNSGGAWSRETNFTTPLQANALYISLPSEQTQLEYKVPPNSAPNPTETSPDKKKANDTKRRSDISALLNAILQYAADNRGNFPETITATPTDIASTGIDLCTILVPGYLTALPTDPKNGSPTTGQAITKDGCGSAYNTGYQVSANITDKRVTVSAPGGEFSTNISLTR